MYAIKSGTASRNFVAKIATYVVKHCTQVRMSSIDFLAALVTSMPGMIMKRWGSGAGFILSSGPTGRSSAKSMHFQFKMRVYNFFGIAGSPSPTHTFACLLATSSACGNSKLIIEPAATAGGVVAVAASIVANVVCTAGTTGVVLKGGRVGNVAVGGILPIVTVQDGVR